MNVSVRRAVLVDGNIREKKDHPESVEVEVVSKLLEAERERQGIRSVPRFTTQLVEKAISTNDSKYWEVAVSDIETSDFDSAAVSALFSQNDTLPVMFVTCIVTSKTKEHLIDMLQVFYHISSNFTCETREIVSKAVTCQWKSLINVLITVVNTSPRSMRDAYFLEMAKFVNAVEIGAESVLMMLNEVVKQKKYEILNVFMRIDSKTCFAKDTNTFETLIQAVKSATITSRHCVMALIAKVVKENPELGDSYKKELSEIVRDTLNTVVIHGYSDKRMILALSFLTEICFDDDPVTKNIATLLKWTSGKM